MTLIRIRRLANDNTKYKLIFCIWVAYNNKEPVIVLLLYFVRNCFYINFQWDRRSARDGLRHENLGPKSMKICRWRFKILSRIWILSRTFICVKFVIFMFLLNKSYQKLKDKSRSNVKIFQKSMVNLQLAKLWIILALKFSELLLQYIVFYIQTVQQNA